MCEKSVVLVIVEGPSDEAALGPILQKYYASDEVQFKVVHGDITTAPYTSLDNILKKINALVESVRKVYGYKKSDFCRIIHIVDTDGAFTKDKVFYEDVSDVKYYEDRIETKDVDSIKQRNIKKSQILLKLSRTNTINKIAYKVYFNSCNLEHVLYGVLKDFSDEEKETMADNFAERYEGHLDNFICFISDDTVAVPGDKYLKTWEYIKKECHSLERKSNMHWIFKEK